MNSCSIPRRTPFGCRSGNRQHIYSSTTVCHPNWLPSEDLTQDLLYIVTYLRFPSILGPVLPLDLILPPRPPDIGLLRQRRSTFIGVPISFLISLPLHPLLPSPF